MVISVTLVSRVGSKTRSEVAFEIELLNFNFDLLRIFVKWAFKQAVSRHLL